MTPETTDGAAASAEPADDAVVAVDVASSPRTARKAATAVGVVMIGLIALLALSGGTDGEPTTDLLGRRVPAVAGAALEGDGLVGGNYDIDDARGGWILVNFFATWCPPCVQEHPDLVRLDEFGDETGELDVVSIVFNDSPENVARFFTEQGGDWPVLSDPSIAVSFQIRRVPESFLVDPDGRVVQHYTGGINADSVLELVTS